MSDNVNNLTLIRSPETSGTAITVTHKQLFQEVRGCAAMCAGLEAMAERAIENGEATIDQLETMVDLSNKLKNELDQLAMYHAGRVNEA